MGGKKINNRTIELGINLVGEGNENNEKAV